MESNQSTSSINISVKVKQINKKIVAREKSIWKATFGSQPRVTYKHGEFIGAAL